MTREPGKRSRRIVFTSEELSHIVAYRKHRERLLTLRFKKTGTYKILNTFNICCIFIYVQMLFCYLGPCNNTKHYAYNTVTRYGTVYKNDGTPIVADVDVYGVNGRVYKFVIDEFIKAPQKKITFIVGKDYLLQKELKGVFEGSVDTYRLFSASPILFLCVFICMICLFAFMFDLNEAIYPLTGISVINLLTILGIIAI